MGEVPPPPLPPVSLDAMTLKKQLEFLLLTVF